MKYQPITIQHPSRLSIAFELPFDTGCGNFIHSRARVDVVLQKKKERRKKDARKGSQNVRDQNTAHHGSGVGTL